MSPEAELDAAVVAARRDYEHERECILQFLANCKNTTEDKKAGGNLASSDHFGSEFDTTIIEKVSTDFLTVSDVRMQVGSRDELIAVATMLAQFRSILPTVPLTTVLADVAGRAVKEAGTRQGTPGGVTHTVEMHARAESVKDITDAAPRKPGGTLAKPGATGRLIAKRLGKEIIDPKTVKTYVEINDQIGKAVAFPCRNQE